MLTVDANETTIDSNPVVELLCNRNTYTERPKLVEQIETHISRVFLTDGYAYKLKKPVKFDFLDFSTPELRHVVCNQELRLNRRMTSDVYLNVLPITQSASRRLQLNGRGTPVDWVVKMRRLPAKHALDRRIGAGNISERDVLRVASKLTDFYQRQPPLTVRTDEYRQQIESHTIANRRELMNREHHFSPRMIKRLDHAQQRLLRLAPDLLDNRVQDGRIIDGHGDLRPEHIYLNGQPTIIDCLEFSAELRSLDVLDELAFLAMECDLLGAEWIGQTIIEHYQRVSGDKAPGVLLAFYKLYRACVRAKVLSLRAAQLGKTQSQQALASAEKYLQLGEQYGHTLGPPILFVVRGLPGSGKSTLATVIAESLNMELIQTDAVRRDLFGPSLRPADFGQRQYHPDARARVYDEVFRRATELLGQGQSVILDGTFLSADLRRQAVELGRRYNAEPLVVVCQCPREVAIGRIRERIETGNSLSQTRPEFYDQQQRLDENDPSDLPTQHLDTTSSLPMLEAEIFTHLRRILFI